jgi:predicted nucleic acid-binding protein
MLLSRPRCVNRSPNGANSLRPTPSSLNYELHGLLLNRLGRRVALETIGELRASQSIVRVRERDEHRAEDILAHFQDKNFSLDDALSFAVMERLGIQVALSLDRHFTQFGWEIAALSEPERERY